VHHVCGSCSVKPAEGASLLFAKRTSPSDIDIQRAHILEETDILRPNHRGANLEEANLYKADLTRADLSWADLSGTNLSGAKLGSGILNNAKLPLADVREAHLGGADLSKAYLGGADLSREPLRPEVEGAPLPGVHLGRVA
jgi:uncharacterized protein YjbI with pentapeptide repeats